MNFIAAIFNSITSFLGFAKQRDAEKNTAALQAAAALKQEQAEKDAATKAVADQNTAKIRDELAE